MQLSVQGDKRLRVDTQLITSKRAVLQNAISIDVEGLAMEVDLRNMQNANKSILYVGALCFLYTERHFWCLPIG